PGQRPGRSGPLDERRGELVCPAMARAAGERTRDDAEHELEREGMPCRSVFLAALVRAQAAAGVADARPTLRCLKAAAARMDTYALGAGPVPDAHLHVAGLSQRTGQLYLSLQALPRKCQTSSLTTAGPSADHIAPRLMGQGSRTSGGSCSP